MQTTFWTFVVVLLAAGVSFAQSSDVKYAAYFAEQTRNLPGEVKVLIDGGAVDQYRRPGSADATSEIFDVEGQDFAKAIRVNVTKPLSPAWLAQLQTPVSTIPVKKGDTLLAIYNVRCISSGAESGGGHFSAHVQLTREPWTGTGSFAGAPGKKWFRGYASMTAERDYAEGELEVTFHLGQYAQQIEFGGLIFLNLGQNIDRTRLPVTRITYVGREADAPWRKEAEARIDKYRKGDLTVKVLDSAGKPVAGAPVHIRMTRHAYQFGTFLEGPTDWNNPDGEQYRKMVLELFNRVTVPIYWADWGWPKAKDEYLGRAKWAQEHGFHVRGHNIIWPDWRWMPTSVRQYEKDPAKLREVIREHFVEICTNFKQFGFDDYDVVNEVRDNHTILDICGKDIIVDWFKLAKQLDPKPRMGINEYSIIAGGGWTQAQQQQYEQMIKYLLDSGAPLGVIGMQCHFGEDLTPPARVVEILDRFGKLNLPIHATEFDVNSADEQAQADYLRDFYTAFFSHPSTEALTMWGFWEKVHWIPRAAMFRPDWSPKANALAYRELVLGKWWTDVSAKTSGDGTITVRGFLGDYEITSAGKTARMALKREGTSVVLK